MLRELGSHEAIPVNTRPRRGFTVYSLVRGQRKCPAYRGFPRLFIWPNSFVRQHASVATLRILETHPDLQLVINVQESDASAGNIPHTHTQCSEAPSAREGSCHPSNKDARDSRFGLEEREVKLVSEYGYNTKSSNDLNRLVFKGPKGYLKWAIVFEGVTSRTTERAFESKLTA